MAKMYNLTKHPTQQFIDLLMRQPRYELVRGLTTKRTLTVGNSQFVIYANLNDSKINVESIPCPIEGHPHLEPIRARICTAILSQSTGKIKKIF